MNYFRFTHIKVFLFSFFPIPVYPIAEALPLGMTVSIDLFTVQLYSLFRIAMNYYALYVIHGAVLWQYKMLQVTASQPYLISRTIRRKSHVFNVFRFTTFSVIAWDVYAKFMLFIENWFY